MLRVRMNRKAVVIKVNVSQYPLIFSSRSEKEEMRLLLQKRVTAFPTDDISKRCQILF
jgi:hypothetical protein